MSYELKEFPSMVQLSVTASGREELFRNALTTVLAASYGTSPQEGASEGQIVPLQAAGDTDEDLLAELVKEALRAIQEEPGTLRPPRWLSFDDRRVTANLPLQAPKAAARRMEIVQAEVTSGEDGWRALLDLIPLGES